MNPYTDTQSSITKVAHSCTFAVFYSKQQSVAVVGGQINFRSSDSYAHMKSYVIQ